MKLIDYVNKDETFDEWKKALRRNRNEVNPKTLTITISDFVKLLEKRLKKYHEDNGKSFTKDEKQEVIKLVRGRVNGWSITLGKRLPEGKVVPKFKNSNKRRDYDDVLDLFD